MKSRFLTVRDDCLTEERSKAEIKNSALRRSDETESSRPCQEKSLTQSRWAFFNEICPLGK